MLREEAIKKHRAMWNWIAEVILNDERTRNIGMLKQMYIEMQGDDMLKMYTRNNCYLCYYADINFTKCPLLWPSDATSFMCEYGLRILDYHFEEGLYSRCLNLYRTDKWKLQAELAYEIANLPERKMSNEKH